MNKKQISRRSALKGLGVIGAAGVLGQGSSGGPEGVLADEVSKGQSDVRRAVFDKVFKTRLVDTHEHLPPESERLAKTGKWAVDDWSVILKHYLNSDMLTAGMPKKDHDMFFSRAVGPEDKWRLLEPWWPAVKNTGYGQAVRIAMRELYGVEELSAATVGKVQEGYARTVEKGFYRRILKDMANIESCQINMQPFMESKDPAFLMYDISLIAMITADIKQLEGRTGINVESIEDWHRVMDWWFATYGKYAVATKSQNAYDRDINYEEVGAQDAGPIFKKILAREEISAAEKKMLEDHCFWQAVTKATEHGLPVKLHTGYYAGDGKMPLARVRDNAASACELCRRAPQTQFVFMHICYPYYEEILSVAKQYANAHVDMCWAWIINPVGAKDFLKKYLVTAPANKILTFGGDYSVVEPVLGHAMIARRGIALALSELVEEGWMSADDAMELTDPIMHGNARRIFKLDEKEKNLKSAPWI